MLMSSGRSDTQVSSRRFPWGMQAVVSIPLPLFVCSSNEIWGEGWWWWWSWAPEGGREPDSSQSRSWQSSSLISNRFRNLKCSIPCVILGEWHRSFHTDRKESFGSMAGGRIFSSFFPSPFTCPLWTGTWKHRALTDAHSHPITKGQTTLGWSWHCV